MFGTRIRAVPRLATIGWGTISLACCCPAIAGVHWEEHQGYRVAPLNSFSGARAGLTLVPESETGVGFRNQLADRTVAHNRVYENGSGVALGDVDGDGLCDIYFCRLEGGNVLYRNLGNWRFEDITQSAGVACDRQFSTGAVLADIDGDGDLDLLVNAIGGGTRAFLNDGKGRFTELTDSRLVRRFGSTSMALADIDGDGDLDLYVTNYRTDTYKDRPKGLKVEATKVGGKIVLHPADRFIPIMPRGDAVEVFELGERDFLYLNDGRGGFAPVSWTSGAFVDPNGKPLSEPPKDWGLTVAFRDMNGDGTPDLYVCNDFFYSLDQIWLNKGSAGFHAPKPTALRNTSMSSMAIDFADINRDGHDDFIVMDMLSRSQSSRHRQRPNMMKGLVDPPIGDSNFRPEVPRNTLFLNRGDGTYAEIAQLSGVAASEWSWSVVFLDVDLDGYEDLLIGTGNTRDVQDADVLQQIGIIRERESPVQRLQRFPSLEVPNIAFRNRGDLTFEEVGARWGFNLTGVSQGIALADLDNDGDLDVVINNMNAPAALYRNESTAPRVAVRLKGLAPNTRGIGAKIRVHGGPVFQSQEMISGGRYVSCDDTVRVFAAGTATNPLTLEIVWRSGKVSLLEGAKPNHIYEIDETYASPPGPALPLTRSASPGSSAHSIQAPATPLFADVSGMLKHEHAETPFDDFARQPLITHRLSQLGPGVAWVDLDRDGREDLVIGSGRGGRLAVFKNAGSTGFVSGARFELASRDQTSILGWPGSKTNMLLLVGSANYEESGGHPSQVLLCNPGNGQSQDWLPAGLASIGPMALADIDGDGHLDLFVGSRVAPGRYPEPVSSRLFKNTAGRLGPDSFNAAVLEKLGLVSGAVFSDLDQDGLPELILACEWGPIRVLLNKKGRFQDATRQLGLEQYAGWWNGVATGDFDGDGRLDIVASNWGRNTKYQEHLAHGVRTFYGDYNQNGSLEVLEAHFDPELKKFLPWRDFETVSRAMPFIRGEIATFRAYGEAGVKEILGALWAKTAQLSVNTLDSMVFLNRGDRFEPIPLPIKAQFAPAFGIAVADFNGDGHQDLFLAQNFFGVEPETSRYDAGQGLLLQGDGRGHFTALSALASGIEIYGEQRGCAVADFDHDGRIDLVVAQNRGAARLYRNLSAQPGLRLRLRGPAENPDAIGAVVRLRFADGQLGPAREIQSGTGYWSQNGAVQVLSSLRRPAAVWVKWPGGKETLTPLASWPPDGELTLTAD